VRLGIIYAIKSPLRVDAPPDSYLNGLPKTFLKGASFGLPRHNRQPACRQIFIVSLDSITAGAGLPFCIQGLPASDSVWLYHFFCKRLRRALA
jgi:hypothetical protein